MPVKTVITPAPSASTVSAAATARRPAIKQAELLGKFDYLQRQRQAGRFAERILRIVSGAGDGVGTMALEIAVKALEANQAPASPLPSVDGNNVKPA